MAVFELLSNARGLFAGILANKDKTATEDEVIAARATVKRAKELIRDNPANTNPDKLEEDVKRAVLEAERKYGFGEERLKHAVELLHDMGYDTTNSLRKDGKQYGDLIAHSIDCQALELEIGLYEIQNGQKMKAENSAEFRAKYGKKRFNASNAGKAHILAYTYWAFLKYEGLSNDELIAQPLYKNLKAYRKKLQTFDDISTFNAYMNLEEWVSNALESALFMRNATKSVIAHFYSIASGAVAGEELRNALGDQANDRKISIWLSTLSVDSLRPSTGSYETVLVLRENIDKGLRYINVYNTLVKMIADAIEIPEFDVFQLDTEPIRTITAQLNEALDLLREAIRKRETVPDEQAIITAPPFFTAKAKEATLEAFRDVSTEAPPIPAENTANTERALRSYVLKGARPWDFLFVLLRSDYWRR